MKRTDVDRLQEHLTARDRRMLTDVATYRLLATRQIQRLHFHDHTTPVAAARACNRALVRLRDLGVLRTLQRRIGGVRAGSAGFVWYLGPAGERLLQALGQRPQGRRSNYREPSHHFVRHTLAVAEVAVQAIELSRTGAIEILELQTEPANWQQALTRYGTNQTLKPDLRLVSATGDYEHHWFFEIDLATEHLPVILRQCAAYETYRDTGRYQATHGLFPAVAWIVPTDHRRSLIQRAIRGNKQLDDELFMVVVSERVPVLLRAGASDSDVPPPDQGRDDEGTRP